MGPNPGGLVFSDFPRQKRPSESAQVERKWNPGPSPSLKKQFSFKYPLTFVKKRAYAGIPDIAKPAARRGRKATGLKEIAGLPGYGCGQIVVRLKDDT